MAYNILRKKTLFPRDIKITFRSTRGSIFVYFCKLSFRYLTIDYKSLKKMTCTGFKKLKILAGNCYYDYSSQFLIAVLACDVLRRGVSKMC